MRSNKVEQTKARGGIASEWLGTLEGDARSDREAYLRNSKLLFDQLREMLQRRYNMKVAVNATDYDNPSWSHKQAHINGYLEALEEISQLLP